MNIVRLKTFCFGVAIALVGVYCLYKAEFLYNYLGKLDGAAPVWNSYALFGWILAPVALWMILATPKTEGVRSLRPWQASITVCLWLLSWFFGLFNELETPYEELEVLLGILAVLHFVCALTLILPSVQLRNRHQQQVNS